jgi:hypothetical protein
VVVDRAEDTAGLDRHHPDAKLSSRQTVDLGADVDRGEVLRCNASRLRRVDA